MQQQITWLDDYSEEMHDRHFEKLLQKAPQNLSLLERIDYFSQSFMDAPYYNGALGEGKQALVDQSPLYRPDCFDCLTYVNTVFALALSENLAEFRTNIVKVNYHNGEAKFHLRHHFMSCDWNIENQRLGLIDDITQQFSIKAELAEAVIDKANFFRHKKLSAIKRINDGVEFDANAILQTLYKHTDQFSPQKASIFYLPMSKILHDGVIDSQLYAEIPEVTIVEIVRPNWDLQKEIGTHLNVSHLGFLFKNAGKLHYRQARLIGKKVVSIELGDYLNQYKDSPTIKGINIQKIN